MIINKILNNKVKTIITIILLVFACFSMNGFYKITLASVANAFDTHLFLINMMVSYILPFICFVIYFYNYYVKKISKKANIIYSSITIALSIFVLINTFRYLDVYMNNNALGVYESMPSLLGDYPNDGLLSMILILLVQIYNLFVLFKPNHKLASIKENYYSLGYFNFSLSNYLLLCLFALVAFFEVGNMVSGFIMIQNVIYNPKYIFVLLWLLLGVFGNFLFYVFKAETRIKTKKNKLIYLGYIISINVILIGLFIIFEITDPNFIAYIAKPLFPITFTASVPVEMMYIFLIQILTLISTIRKTIFYSKE